MRIGGSILVVLVALALPASGVSSGVRAHKPAADTKTQVRIVFTGKGGGRYLDVTRWLEDSSRECYARSTADETLSVSWKLTWNATLIRRNGRLVLGRHSLVNSAVNGGVVGTAVRDFCDDPEDGAEEVGANWPGTTKCDGPMAVATRGSMDVRPVGKQGALILEGPHFGSPPKPCELNVRNDQLAAGVAANAPALRRLASTGAASASVAVGTRHGGTGVTYVPTRLCSHFPHIYEGIVYLYDCEDTLTWDGTVTFTRIAG